MSLPLLKSQITYDPIKGSFIRKTGRYKGLKTSCINNSGYIVFCVNNKNYLAHRVAWILSYGKIPNNCEIDHINHNRADNRLVNLRLVSKSENGKNLSMSSNNKSGITGVCWDNTKCRWRASITVDGTRIGLGYFIHKEDASLVRKNAELEYGFHENHGNPATLN